LTVFFCIGTTFTTDLFLTGIRFNLFTSPSDYLRKIVSRNLNIEQYKKEFDDIFAVLKTRFVKEDLEREKELQKRRELLANELNKSMAK
jgi:hypothetical protein